MSIGLSSNSSAIQLVNRNTAGPAPDGPGSGGGGSGPVDSIHGRVDAVTSVYGDYTGLEVLEDRATTNYIPTAGDRVTDHFEGIDNEFGLLRYAFGCIGNIGELEAFMALEGMSVGEIQVYMTEKGLDIGAWEALIASCTLYKFDLLAFNNLASNYLIANIGEWEAWMAVSGLTIAQHEALMIANGYTIGTFESAIAAGTLPKTDFLP